MRQTKPARQADGSVVEVGYTVEYPPDTPALSLWLRNRRRGDWRERHEVEVADQSEPLLEGMSEEQLIQRLMLRRKPNGKEGAIARGKIFADAQVASKSYERACDYPIRTSRSPTRQSRNA